MHLRFDPGHESSLFEVPWEIDCQYRTNPEVFTRLLHDQVPVLEYVEWRVETIDPGKAASFLPLNTQSTNQHFTHQAALIVLSADYTGGIALCSLPTGWPLIGIHPVKSPRSMSLWLLKVDIKFLRPSIGDMTATAEVAEDQHDRIRRRFAAGKPVIETVPVFFWNGDKKIAEAQMTYYMRQSENLRSDGSRPDKVNVLYQVKLTSSAEMIAGVRARVNGGLFDDPYAEAIAGQHGMALATRFCERMPELGGMVAARTKHLDTAMQDFVAQGGRNIVLLGVGWDMRPYRLPWPEGTNFFELDFSTTLLERQKRLDEIGVKLPDGVSSTSVPIDLRTQSLAAALEGSLDFSSPVFVAWEGMTMYFEAEDVRSMFRGIAPVLENPSSRLWCDLVSRSAIETPERHSDSVEQFMLGMQILGEPFLFGVDSAEQFMQEQGFRCEELERSDVYMPDNSDPIYDIYHFCLASFVAAPAYRLDGPESPAGARVSRTVKREPN